MVGSSEELKASRDLTASTLLLKLVSILEKGLDETKQLSAGFKEYMIEFSDMLGAVSALSADKTSRHRLVNANNKLLMDLDKWKHPMPRLIKKDITKIKQAMNFAAGEHWGLYQLTILAESVEGMKKVNLLPNQTSIPETLMNTVKSLSKRLQDEEDDDGFGGGG